MKRLVLCSLLLLFPGGVCAQTAWLPALRDTLDRLQDAGARRRLLQDAARSHPSDAWPHLALALAYGGAAPSDSAPLLRRDPGDQGWKELQRALAADATFAPAAIALAMQALGVDLGLFLVAGGAIDALAGQGRAGAVLLRGDADMTLAARDLEMDGLPRLRAVAEIEHSGLAGDRHQLDDVRKRQLSQRTLERHGTSTAARTTAT